LAAQREELMRKIFFATAMMTIGSLASAQAQTPLSSYADKEGWLNVQALTCGELADTFQEDADMLTTWYSGWYNGLAKKHYINVPRSKEAEHEVIIYCKKHRDKKIIDVIGHVIDEYRTKHGIELSK
jgi:inactivated superfamily I helicase